MAKPKPPSPSSPNLPTIGRAYVANAIASRIVGIEAIRGYDNHARTRTRKAENKLARSIEAFGQLLPVVVDESLTIVDGHAVWAALKKLGRREVWIAVVAARSDAEIRALRFALNRLPQDTGWQSERVRKEIETLIDLGFDLELTGFEAVEIDQMLEIDIPTANRVEDDDIPTLRFDHVSRLGDIWICGDHRLGCGDATDFSFIAQLLNGTRADMCFVDPPYNVPVDGFATGKGRKAHREFLQASGEMTEAEFISFLHRTLSTLVRCSSENALIYCCMDWRHLWELFSAAKECALSLLNLCVWTKTNAGMGSFYRSQHEHIAVLGAPGGDHMNNVELGRKGRNRSNVWAYRGMNSFGPERDGALAVHPTVKPVLLIADAIRDCTKRGQLVLDTFLGSGSTLIAAEETGRICAGCDLDPAYVDVAVRRWQMRTHRDAIHAASGETFEERSARSVLLGRGVQHG